ncbi:MAG: peptidase, partial [Gammaproteobacteria bacterium]|nr:peptidase [Gammaproteobacteria bacterium]
MVRTIWLGIVFLGLIGALSVTGGAVYLFVNLPSLTELKDTRLQVPLRVYTRDEYLIGEFGGKRRIPLEIEDIPDTLIKAVLAAEDKHFFEHPGVDWQGLMRAVIHLVRTGEKGPGGSTITMQVARNFFLGREKTYLRKANEILLALRIEQEFTKEEILALYLNKIFFGQRAYGVGAAAQVYYGITLDELTLAQVAMIAGLPKAPSRFNPIAGPKQASVRRNYVLHRMHELGFISDTEYAESIDAQITAR